MFEQTFKNINDILYKDAAPSLSEIKDKKYSSLKQ